MTLLLRCWTFQCLIRDSKNPATISCKCEGLGFQCQINTSPGYGFSKGIVGCNFLAFVDCGLYITTTKCDCAAKQGH